MLTIIIGAIVSLLVFFFERWWSANHPIAPTEAQKAEFVAHVGKTRYFWMGSKRQAYAGKVFDKFAANYAAKPVILTAGAKPLSADQARGLASQLATNINVDDVKGL